LNPRIGRHSFTLQRAEPPKKVRITEVKPLTNGVEILVQPPETGGLPLIEYTVKYSVADNTDEQQQTLIIPGIDFFINCSMSSSYEEDLSGVIKRVRVERNRKITERKNSPLFQFPIYDIR